MSKSNITLNGRSLRLHKSSCNPNFAASTVLCNDPWDFVAMWLARNSTNEAELLWRQARSFFDASELLPKASAPLAAYYCFLNATNCFLTVSQSNYSAKHGVSGNAQSGKTSLSNEIIRFQSSGTHGALRQLLGDGTTEENYSLKDLLYNIPFIHRAYTLTYRSAKNLYIPISNPEFVRKNSSSESWVQFEVPGRYGNHKTLSTFDPHWEHVPTSTGSYVVRLRKRFVWRRGDGRAQNVSKLTTYHARVRRELHFISGSSRLWYIKRSLSNDTPVVDVSPLSIMFAAMHRLSELSRYSPLQLDRHFECKHNWLLSEFIAIAPVHFVDAIASEITGFEFLPSGIDSRLR